MNGQQFNCPHGHGLMELKRTSQRMIIRDIEITGSGEQYVCQRCGFEASTMKQASGLQRSLIDAYRSEKGLMTGLAIKAGRKGLDMTQQDLADAMAVGIASIKRWEGGTIQTPGMDKLLRQTLGPGKLEDVITGSRRFSPARIKSVLMEFNRMYREDLLADDDCILQNTELLWYADMVSYRDLGRSLTGATYAAFPKGPYLNNLVELVTHIMESDERKGEPLTLDEESKIKQVHTVFPLRFDAHIGALKEAIWKKRRLGEIIPYSDSSGLTGM